MMKTYSKYNLSENPFPQSATIDVTSTDKRVNGSIFSEEVLSDQIRELDEKLARKINLIYLLGFEWEKGTGKSALIVNAWKKQCPLPNVASIYLKCSNVSPYSDPSGFCIGIVKQLHKNNVLWKSLKTLLKKYVEEVDPLFPKEAAIETLFNAFPITPTALPLTRYTHVTNSKKLALDLARWLNGKRQLDESTCQKWLNVYLTSPISFEETLDKMGRGMRFDCYHFFINLLNFLGVDYFYIFLDQFEDAFMKVPNPKVAEFCLEMRRILETGSGLTTIAVTLHPDGETKLSGMGSEQLTQIAPLDTNHIVSVMTLRTKVNLAIPLSQAYLEKFRTLESPYPTYPFAPEALELICQIEGGNIRQLLQRLYYCLEYALENDVAEITPKVICDSPLRTIGREFKPEECQIVSKYTKSKS